MRSLNDMLKESIFDIDDNIDNIDHDVSSMGKMGIKSIVLKIFDGKHIMNITDDENIKKIFRNCLSKDIFKEIDTKIFEKKIKILDEHWEKLDINDVSENIIYTIVERCCKEILYAQENHKGIVDAYMNSWIKHAFNGVGHQFKYWRRTGTFGITFEPKNEDILIRLICSIRTK